MLIRLCSKSFKLGFGSIWTENFQMYKLGLEKAEESGSNGQHLLDIGKAKEFQKNIYFCFINYTKAFHYVHHNKLWKILQETGIPDHLTCLLRNLHAGQGEKVRTGHGTMDQFKTVKVQSCILSLCLFNYYAEYIMWNARLDEAQAGIKLLREILTTSGMQMMPL